MHPLNALILGLVVAWAVKRRNGINDLGPWRWIAAVCGSLFAYAEYAFLLMGPGAYAQAYHGIFWSVLLLPLYAFLLATIIGVFSGKGWQAVFWPVAGGLVGTWLLGALTEEGVFPLALLIDWRLGAGLLNGFDFILLGLCALGILLALMFPAFDRDFARLTLIGVVGYLALTVFWAWQAYQFGERYAEALKLGPVKVRVLPQPLSPQNWRVMVEEPQGRLHDTLINLSRTKELKVGADASRAARIDALYKPRDHAVWKIYRRFGAEGVSEDTQRRVRRAWYAWQAGPYGWYGRYAVFDQLYNLPAAVGGVDLGCISFTDIRYLSPVPPARGRYLVCPSRTGGGRVFQPTHDDGTGWREWIPVMAMDVR